MDDTERIVDGALRRHGDLGAYGDLRAGLAALRADLEVKILPGEDAIRVQLWPRSGEGHAFSFEVVPSTRTLRLVVVENVARGPEPDGP